MARLGGDEFVVVLEDLGEDALQSVDDCLKQADLAMYLAKAAGRNTRRFFDVATQFDVDSRVALESDLRDGGRVFFG